MNADTSPQLLKLLAHDIRWQLVKTLSVGDYRVNELVDLVEHPLNLVSYHLKLLREGQIVRMRRSEADGRDTYYSLDLDHLRELYHEAGMAIHSAVIGNPEETITLSSKSKVLFICTHNSARSQMAEGLMRWYGQGQIDVYSAGSEPATIHPDAITTMDSLNIDIRSQQSKSLDHFIDQSFDTVITVCDRAREVCPTFPGDNQALHWGFPDPVIIDDTLARQQAFQDIATRLQSRIQHFIYNLE